MAPLYHATSIENVEGILRRGFDGVTLQSFYTGPRSATQGRYGVSFTRDIKSADWYMKNEYVSDFYVVFVVDQLKLNANFKVRPVDYFSTQALIGGHDAGRAHLARKEKEEFAIVNRRWDDSARGYVGAIPSQKVTTKILYWDFGPSATEFEKEYMREIDKLKSRWVGYKWEARKR